MKKYNNIALILFVFFLIMIAQLNTNPKGDEIIELTSTEEAYFY